MSAIHDSTLSVPEATPPVPPLDVADPELGLAARPGDEVVLLEGERGAARVRDRGELELIRLDGRTVASGLALEAGVVANLVASPAALRLERVVDGASLHETILLPPRLPLLALQLHDARGGASGGPFHGSVTLLPHADGVRWRSVEGRLVVVDDAHPEQPVVMALSPGPAHLSAEAATGGGLRVRFTLATDQASTLVLTVGRDGPHDPLAPVRHLAGHARMATAAPAGGVTLATGIDEMDAGLAWARTRLSTAARRTAPTARPWALFWSGLGALAAADETAAGAFLERLETAVGQDEDDRASGHPLTLPAAPLPLLLAARHALTLGDASPALRQAARLDPERLQASALDGGTALLWSMALASVADALRWAVGEDEAARHRRLGAAMEERAHAGGREPGAGVRLPMAGQAPAEGVEGAAASLHRLLGTGRARPASVTSALAPWAAFREERPAEGYTLWRSALAGGLRAGPAGRGTWDGWRPAPEVPETGLVLAGLVHGLMGWAPDAPVGRVGLAPRLPEHVTRFEIQGLRVGPTVASLAYRRDGEVRRFVLEPTGGRAPATVVFEPLLAIAGLREALLDGEPVDLDPRETPGGLSVPLQIPLDATRTVELVGPERER